MLRFRFKACIKCRGDLALDDGDWICLQCGTYYYVGLYRVTQPVEPVGMTGPVGMEGVGIESRDDGGPTKGLETVSSVSLLSSEPWIALGLTVRVQTPELIRQ